MAEPQECLHSAFNAYRRDLERMNTAFEQAGAVAETADGFKYIDEAKAPASLVRAYRLLALFGAANGLPLAGGDSRG